MNEIIITGRLTKDPELKTTSTGKEVCKFSVAVQRTNDREKADFFNVSAWGATGAFVDKYFKKGQAILLRGAMQSNSWQDDNGAKHTSWEIWAEKVEFNGSKQNSEPAQQNSALNTPSDVALDNDLPF